MTKTATITLRRHQWAEIVSGWGLYRAVIRPEFQDPRFRGVMPGLCETIARRLRQDSGDSISIEGSVDGWNGVAIWVACVSCRGAKPVGTSAIQAIAEAISGKAA